MVMGRCKGAWRGVAVVRESASPVKCIKKVCQLVGRCDGHGGDVRRLLVGVTFVRKCVSSKGSDKY